MVMDRNDQLPTGLVVQNLDLFFNLYGKRSKLISGSSMIFT